MKKNALTMIALTALLLPLSTLLADSWPSGTDITIASGTTITVDSPLASISTLTNNGTLNFNEGASLVIQSSRNSAIGSGSGNIGTLNMNGGQLTHQGTGYLVVGHLGAEGFLNIGANAELFVPNSRLCISYNASGMRDLPSYGTVSVAGLLSVSRLETTGYFPNDLDTPPYPVSATLIIEQGGILEVGDFQNNDHASSEIIIQGGTIRALQDANSFIIGNSAGTLEFIVADNTSLIFDSNGKNIFFRKSGTLNDLLFLGGDTSPEASNNGGLIKVGAGSLIIEIPPENNQLNGPIVVQQGTLGLGRPLADGQTVTVYPGATFLPYTPGDLNNVTFLDEDDLPLVYTVTYNTSDLDLVALNATYFDDRLAGPISGQQTPTLSGTLTHAADSAQAPFRLLGNGGTLNLDTTSLYSSYLQLEGPGTFNFLGRRDFTYADSGKLTITDGGYRQDTIFKVSDVNTATPATLTLDSGRFNVGEQLEVGIDGYGTFNAAGATIKLSRFNIGAGTDAVGTFNMSSGDVESNNESYLGYDNGTGYMNLTGGELKIHANFRIASNPSGMRELRPDAVLNITDALLRCNELKFNPNWTSDGSAKNIEAGFVNLYPDGILEIQKIHKNDDPIATINFRGGTLRARVNHDHFFSNGQGNATLKLQAIGDDDITLDTAGYDIVIKKDNGKTIFTGTGGLQKLGSGTLTLSATEVSYQGDTTVAGGTLKLGASQQIPDGANAGNLVLAADSTFDLNGKLENINRLQGYGTLISTKPGAILGVLNDNSSDTWEFTQLGSDNVELYKLGSGTLTLAAANAVPHNLNIANGTVKVQPTEINFRFYRFKVESVKNPDTANSMQVAEIALFNGSANVTANRSGINYDSTGGEGTDAESNAYPPAEKPEKAVDGALGKGSKWLDFRMKASRSAEDKERVWLQINFNEPQHITHYNWATANDNDERDPAAWRLQGSYDNTQWYDLDVRTGYTATSTRDVWVEAEGFELQNAANLPSIAPSATVLVGTEATLELDNTTSTIASISGNGTVELNDSTLVLQSKSDSDELFTGTISGTGSLTKLGTGTQTLTGSNTYTGSTVVEQGTLKIENAQPMSWFRYTVTKNKSNFSETQLSEFALYGNSGQRLNTGLTQGSDVASLQPGEFATPSSYSHGNNEGPDEIFDNNTATKWCLTGNVPAPDTPSTHRTIVMRLSDAVTEIYSYNLCTANDEPGRDPVNWLLEGSSDGVNWVILDTREGVAPPSTGGTGVSPNTDTGRFLYYNEGVPFTLHTRAVVAGTGSSSTGAIPTGSQIEVRDGATLTITTADTISALKIDMTSSGTINGFNPTPEGILHITNASGEGLAGLALPLNITSSNNLGSLSKWAIYVDGIRQNGVVLKFNSETGKLELHASGTTIFIR